MNYKFDKSKLKYIHQFFKDKSNIALLIISSAVLAYVLASFWIFYEEIFQGESSLESYNSKGIFFNNNPTYMLWLASILIQPIVWVMLAFPVTGIIFKLKDELKPPRHLIISFLLIVLAFYVFTTVAAMTFNQYFDRPKTLLSNHTFKLRNFTNVGQIVGLYYLFTAIIISKAVLRKETANYFDIACYQRFRKYLDIIINFTGIIFSLGVISAILLRKVVNNELECPIEFVVSFGVQNTIMILIFYLPAHFILVNYGRQILEKKFTFEGSDIETGVDLLNKQNEFTKNLNLSFGIVQQYKTALVILSPLISSLIPNLLGIFTK